jgi:hypothetical protein
VERLLSTQESLGVTRHIGLTDQLRNQLLCLVDRGREGLEAGFCLSGLQGPLGGRHALHQRVIDLDRLPVQQGGPLQPSAVALGPTVLGPSPCPRASRGAGWEPNASPTPPGSTTRPAPAPMTRPRPPPGQPRSARPVARTRLPRARLARHNTSSTPRPGPPRRCVGREPQRTMPRRRPRQSVGVLGTTAHPGLPLRFEAKGCA